MSTGSEQKNNDKNTNVTGRIVITSPHENVIAACHKVLSSGKMFGGKLSPQYALFGVDNVSSSFWENPIFFRMVCR